LALFIIYEKSRRDGIEFVNSTSPMEVLISC